MRFGSREVADVVFRAKGKQVLGSRTFYKNEPVLYFDTLKTSGLEGAATTVYAQGGRGNPRLIAWEGERTMTFTMEDALISPEGLAILTGAGLISAADETPVYQHMTSRIEVKADATIEVPELVCYNTNITSTGMTVSGDSNGDYQKGGADVFVMVLQDGIVISEPCVPNAMALDIEGGKTTITCDAHEGAVKGAIVLVDYYVKRVAHTQQIEITADKFGGYYYIEASTLFRDEATGEDLPAEFIIPNGKVQSNFNFAMANSGDPSTFTFTVDAMPGYTKFDGTKKVLAVIQVIEDALAAADEVREACNGEIDAPPPKPLTGLKVDANVASTVDLFGKTVDELQSNILISDDNKITGTLKYVDDYTGFSSKIDEQSGNYIVIHAEVPGVDDAAISVKVTNPVVLDDDGIAVLRIADKDSQTITVVASKSGLESVTKVYSLSGLTVETE